MGEAGRGALSLGNTEWRESASLNALNTDFPHVRGSLHLTVRQPWAAQWCSPWATQRSATPTRWLLWRAVIGMTVPCQVRITARLYNQPELHDASHDKAANRWALFESSVALTVGGRIMKMTREQLFAAPKVARRAKGRFDRGDGGGECSTDAGDGNRAAMCGAA
jgi:hypothetical protein